MDVQYWANVAEVVSGLAVVAGIGFGVLQYREYRGQREDAMAAELMRSFHEPDFTRALNMIHVLPIGCDPDLIECSPELRGAAILLAATFEAVGLLVYRRTLRFDLVLELCGGMAMVIWKRLERWTELVRAQREHLSFAEWFQWLAERLEEAGKATHRPAYERCRGWKPE